MRQLTRDARQAKQSKAKQSKAKQSKAQRGGEGGINATERIQQHRSFCCALGCLARCTDSLLFCVFFFPSFFAVRFCFPLLLAASVPVRLYSQRRLADVRRGRRVVEHAVVRAQRLLGVRAAQRRRKPRWLSRRCWPGARHRMRARRHSGILMQRKPHVRQGKLDGNAQLHTDSVRTHKQTMSGECDATMKTDAYFQCETLLSFHFTSFARPHSHCVSASFLSSLFLSRCVCVQLPELSGERGRL
jgi:hypothetical protein